MAKLLLMSILFATAAIPIFFAHDRSPHRGLKRSLLALLVFNIIYVLLLFWVFIPLMHDTVYLQ